MRKIIKNSLQGNKKALELLEKKQEAIEKIALLFIRALKKNKKIIFAGNGGSAADAQHLSAEIVGRFKKERRGLPSLALSVNTSTLTAIANDYSYEDVFRRQIEALGQSGDIFVGISTSGNSPNIIAAAKEAKKMGLNLVAFCGKPGSALEAMADISLVIDADTPRIQEMHILAGHILCEIIDAQVQ